MIMMSSLLLLHSGKRDRTPWLSFQLLRLVGYYGISVRTRRDDWATTFRLYRVLRIGRRSLSKGEIHRTRHVGDGFCSDRWRAEGDAKLALSEYAKPERRAAFDRLTAVGFAARKAVAAQQLPI